MFAVFTAIIYAIGLTLFNRNINKAEEEERTASEQEKRIKELEEELKKAKGND